MKTAMNVRSRSLGCVIGLGLGRFTFVGGGVGLMISASAAFAGPDGPSVVRGQATIQQNGRNTVITAGNNAVINYQSFSIGASESVRFIQPSATSRVLNRVTGADPTRIDGTLTANGRVYIVNPAGVSFGQGAVVNAAGLFAAAGRMTDADFLAGRDRFTGTGTVDNAGTIRADAVHLVGRQVVNSGTIVAEGGIVTMNAGGDVLIGERDGTTFARIRGAAGSGSAAAIENSGTVRAEGGAVLFGVGDAFALAVDASGDVRARTIEVDGGARGIVSVSGTLDASSAEGVGGRVVVTGEKVGLFGATIDASGSAGGGEVLLGGEYQGRGNVRNAEYAYVGEDSSVRADATQAGNGGRVIVWSEEVSRVHGEISARGGSIAGQGGFVETSSRNYLDVTRTPDVTASRGAGGLWLIDPNNITIVAGSTATNINSTNPFASTANSAQLGVNLITAALTGGASVSVTTATGGANSQVGNITLNTTLNYNGTGTNTLTFSAHNNIVINGQITDSSPGGDSLNLVLVADSDASGAGDVDINAAINLGGGTFSSSGVHFDNTGASISAASLAFTHTGNVNVFNTTATNLGASTIGGTLTVLTTAGGITDSGVVTVGGASAFSSFGSDDDIVIDQLDSSGAVSLTTIGAGGNATVVNASALDIASANVGGDLSLDADTGNLTASGAVVVGGNASLATSQTNADISIADLTVAGTIALSTVGATGDATITNSSGLTFATSTIGGSLSATATTGDISDSGTVTIGGTSSFIAADADSTITLDQIAATGAVSVTTAGANGDVTLANAGALILGTSTIGGSLDASATSGNITDTGTVTVGGNAIFLTFGTNDDITLDQLAVTGTVAVDTIGSTGHATIVNATALDLAGSNVGGNFSATAATGNVTDSGLVVVGGNAAFVAGNSGDDIVLDELAVAGSLSLTTSGAGGHATVVNAIALDLGASSVGGNLAATASTGNLTDSGTITVGGNASFTTSNANDDIIVNQLAVSGSVAVNTTGSTGNATVVNATALDLAASSVGGDLSATASTGNLTDSGTVMVGGDAAFTTSNTDDDIVVNQLNVTGVISVNTTGASGDATIVEASSLDIGASNVGGTLLATSTIGNMTDSGTISVGGGAAFTTSATNAGITLDQLAVTGAISPITTGGAANVTIVNASAVNMASWTVGGNLSVTATTGNITDSGTVTVGGNATFTTSQTNADIIVDDIDVTGSVSLFTTGATGHATIVDASGLILGASSIGGNLDATATLGTITDSGTVTVAGDASFTASQANMSIVLDSLAVAGSITPSTSGAGANVTIGNATAVDVAGWTVGGNLTVIAATGNITDSGSVTVGGNASFTTSQTNADIVIDDSAVTGSISVNTTGSTGHATITHATGVDLGASSVGGNLTVTATTGNITDSGAVAVGGNASFTTSQTNDDITVDQLAVTGSVAVNTTGATGHATIVNATALNLAASSVGGSLAATASTGNLTDSGTITVGGNATLTTSNTNDDILADQLVVTGTVAVNTTGSTGHATVVNATALDLAASSVGGDLSATATTGNVTDSGTITVGGNATLTTSNANDDITVDQLAVTGAVSVNTTGATGHATVVNATALNLGASSVGGNLAATATSGNLTDSGTVTVGGNATLTTINANDDILADQLAVAGTVAVNTTGATGHATIVNATALDLAASAVGGNLSATATTGNVTDSGAVTVGGNASFTTSQTNADIVIDDSAVTGSISVSTTGSTGHATITHATGVDLGVSSVGGDLNVTATTGNITDSGTVTVGGNASFTTSNTNDDITVDQLAVTGTIAVNTTGATGHATIVNATDLDLAASTIGGNLSATATTGNVTDAGAITVGGNAAFTTSQANADIVIDDSAVTGSIRVNTTGSTGHATVTHATGVDLGASSVGGNLTVTATTGNITDSGTVTVGGNATLTTSNANDDI
ncbi:MAG: filamentous hemagglutinin N-terminal domain-containing protein, partial [Phycisphaerae bacterium]|nr:filamentous hemagglutinin N-terminal domain-containing protein [Phycisphaerae bacterium]